MFSKRVAALSILASSICFSTALMSLHSISTADWSTISSYKIGLFYTCVRFQCVRNEFGANQTEMIVPPIYPDRYFNAGPLAIAGVFLQLICCFLCCYTAFVYLPGKPSLTCYITPFLLFIAFLFQFSTINEASYGIHLTGRSSQVFQSALVLLVVNLFITTLAADRIRQLTNIERV